jgi:hypothetical protein
VGLTLPLRLPFRHGKVLQRGAVRMGVRRAATGLPRSATARSTTGAPPRSLPGPRLGTPGSLKRAAHAGGSGPAVQARPSPPQTA